jgi:cobalt-zinc-cadmium efflux system outer membrane protein
MIRPAMRLATGTVILRILLLALAAGPARASQAPGAGTAAPAAPRAGVAGDAAVSAQPALPLVPPSATLTLDQAITLALATNRGIAAARLGREVAAANVEVARERPNPDLSFEEDRETPHDILTLSQPIESAGKRRRRVVLAQAQAASGEADLARSVADLRNQVRRAYYTLAAVERRATLGDVLLGLAGRTLDTARQRFDAGDAPRLEVLQAELASAQADNEARGVRSLLAAARADLNTLLARPPEAPVATGGDLTGTLAAGAVPAFAAAAGRALAANAELALLDRRIAEEGARLDLARAQRYPDPAVSGAVTHRSPPDFDWGWHAGVTVNLPLFTRHQAAVTVEERTLAQLTAQRAARAAAIGGEVYSAAVQAETARLQALRFRDEILPRAEQVERLAEDSYRSGQTGLAALLQAFQATRDVRLQAIQAGLDYQNALADLEKAMGVPLP